MMRHHYARDDAGFSLTELAVYIVLLGIVASMVAAVVITSFQAEQTVSGTTSVANDSQSVIANLDRDIRNSRSVQPASGSSTTLQLCVAESDPEVNFGWYPVIWAFSGDDLTRSARGGATVSLLTETIQPSSGIFTVSGSTVSYTFSIEAAGTATREFSGVTALSPAHNGEAC